MQPAAIRRPIRVAIVNDVPLIVAGLAALLAPYGRRVVVREMAVATDRVMTEEVDVVLYDVFAADRRVVTIPRALKPKPRGTKVIFFGWTQDVALIEDGLKHGIDGFIHKRLSASRIVEVIERVAKGEQLVALTEGQTSVSRATVGISYPGKEQGLTPRESEVVALITRGMSNVDIARSLFLSPNSIKSIIKNAYRKMGVGRRGEAVAWGVTHGFPASPQKTYRIVYPDKSEGTVP